MTQQIIDLVALLKTPCVDSDTPFDISPDGKKVAFSWNKTGQWEIYELLLDGTGMPARQVTRGEGNKFSPHYSPGGERLAYMVDFDGGESFRLFVHDFSSGELTPLAPNEPADLQPNFAWSPDGTQITILSNRSGCFNTYILPATAGADRQVLDTPYPDWKVQWSPDGGQLLVISETRGQDYGVFIVPAQGGAWMQISDGRDPFNARSACWSPDGSRIAFSSDARGPYDIGIYTLASGEITWLTSGDGDKTNPDWSPDGLRLVYVHSQDAASWLAVQALDATPPLTYQIEPGLHYLPRFTPDGKAVLCVFDNPRCPDDLWLLSLKDGAFRRLTDSLPPELGPAPFVMPSLIHYPAMDGASVPALLYRPLQVDQRPPAVVLVHGGPNWRYDLIWHPLVQHMVSRGWVVLQPNYRGSTGYGRQWQYASRFDQGGVDTRDVVDGAQYLIQHGLADPARIAVTGASHGGYLTMTALTQYPDLWAAGSAVVPFLNWFTSHANSRDDLQHWDQENFGDPVKDHDLWYERSPYFFLDRVKAPVQLICGGNDPRCPPGESIAARDALQALGKSVEFHIYPDEGHGFLKTANVVDSAQRRVAFLANVLDIHA